MISMLVGLSIGRVLAARCASFGRPDAKRGAAEAGGSPGMIETQRLRDLPRPCRDACRLGAGGLPVSPVELWSDRVAFL